MVDVYWSTRRNACNLIRVKVEDKNSDLYETTIAELAVIRYLLGDKEIFGSNFSGSGLKLVLSDYDALELLSGSSEYEHDGYPVFYWIRYRGSEASVVEDPFWPQAWVIESQDELTVTKADHDVITTPRLGRVIITLNAVHSYKRYLFAKNNPSKCYWKSLVKCLRDSNLRQVSLPDNVSFRKKLKYSNNPGGEGEIWKGETSTLHFVLTQDKARSAKTLVTVFMRKEKQAFFKSTEYRAATQL